MPDPPRYARNIRIPPVPVSTLDGCSAMTRDVEERIAATAAVQHGVITRGQLKEAGLSADAIDRRLKLGILWPIQLGVYGLGPVMLPRAPEMAAVLACAPEALLSHVSAVRVWLPGEGLSSFPDPTKALEGRGDRGSSNGPRARSPNRGRHAPSGRGEPRSPNRGRHAPSSRGEPAAPSRARRDSVLQSDTGPVHITVVGGNRGQRPGIFVHRVARLETDERAVRDGIPVTAPGRSLIDLAGMVGTRELEHAVARAEREGLVTLAALAKLVDRYRGRPGAPALRHVLRDRGGPALTLSEAEELFLALAREGGLPDPETNVPVGPYVLDFLWGKERIAVEIDGFRYHKRRPQFEGDRRKDAWLHTVGITVLRFTWRQVTRERVATAIRIGQALAIAAAAPRREDPGDHPAAERTFTAAATRAWRGGTR